MQRPPIELRPNCLLTRYPICFVHGLKSFIVAYKYWNGIPQFLAAHGYETHEFQGPWRGPHQARLLSFRKQFEKVWAKHEKAHVIAHSMGTLDLTDLLKDPHFSKKTASVTFISPPFGGSPFGDAGLLFGQKLFSSTNEVLTASAASAILEGFKKPQGVLLGAIISRPQNYPLSYLLRAQHFLLSQYLRAKKKKVENDGLVPLESQLIALGLVDFSIEFPGDHHQVIGGGPWPDNIKTAHEMFLEHAIFLAEYDFKTAK